MAQKKSTAGKRKSTAKRPARRAAGAKRRPARRARPKPAKRNQPETLRLQSAAPGFTVNDIQRSLAWYRDVLGFVVKERWEHGGQLAGVELLAGTVSFYIGQDDWKKGRDRKKGEGFRIYCTTAQDVDRLAATIVARGGVLEQEPKTQPWGAREFAVADPDGFKVTIASER